MSQCKAITGSGEQCSREARDGKEMCAIPSHAAQEEVEVPQVQVSTGYKYGFAILAVGEVAAPEIGGYSGEGAREVLQSYHDRGYDLFSVESGDELELANSKKYMRMVFVFVKRE